MDNTELKIKEGTRYAWKEDDTFTLTGKEFSILYNSLSNIITSDNFKAKLVEAKETLTIMDLHKVMNQSLNKAIESGIVTEANE